MAPNISESSPDAGSNVISRIYLIRHGDRFDYANPSWLDSARDNGALITDPPLSALGHRQAMETADHLWKMTKNNDQEENNTSNDHDNEHHVDQILVSPYLRVIQTACPTSNILGIPLSIENGLAEAHATPGSVLPSPKERFVYFPQINPTHASLLNVQPTPGYICPKTGHPCEAFAGKYCQRMEQFASCLEQTYFGKNIVLFSHAASVALVAAFLKCSLRSLKFAPCGIYHLQRINDGPWALVQNGESNEEYVKENSSTTYPWGFSEKHFDEDSGGHYFGSSDGIDLDYFVQKKSKM
eukprot:CAMPEP_0172312718 /NCGR_PEP_ID=MMETSP1058-20130122/18484_1 /TAXON_ID=83371 /ORGANISM="Detonula confervacea, Strain CCMP 353" /LENGTH=297 /DNA_ID=CAMNT_0013026261 /DNA_START=29 /DNA_END=922 /DNA_ORIENTATION=+